MRVPYVVGEHPIPEVRPLSFRMEIPVEWLDRTGQRPIQEELFSWYKHLNGLVWKRLNDCEVLARVEYPMASGVIDANHKPKLRWLLGSIQYPLPTSVSIEVDRLLWTATWLGFTSYEARRGIQGAPIPSGDPNVRSEHLVDLHKNLCKEVGPLLQDYFIGQHFQFTKVAIISGFEDSLHRTKLNKQTLDHIWDAVDEMLWTGYTLGLALEVLKGIA